MNYFKQKINRCWAFIDRPPAEKKDLVLNAFYTTSSPHNRKRSNPEIKKFGVLSEI
jgi:hypothetical protein